MSKNVKRVTNSVSSIAKNPLDPKGYANLGVSTVTGGFADAGGLEKLVLGKKDKGKADSYVPLDPIQMKALGQYNSLLDKTGDMAGAEANRMENQIRQNTADSQMRAQDLVRQRGLGNSSVGLNAILSQSRDMGDKIAATRAAIPEMQLDRLNKTSSGIEQILQGRIFKQGREGGGRVGGILPFVTAGLGGYFGGAGGAQAGMGLGQYINQSA